jgi:hypothetical protein
MLVVPCCRRSFDIQGVSHACDSGTGSGGRAHRLGATVCRVLSLVVEDGAAGSDGEAVVYLSQMVLSALELGRPVASVGTARTIVCHWGRQATVTRWLVIHPFELKFDRLN